MSTAPHPPMSRPGPVPLLVCAALLVLLAWRLWLGFTGMVPESNGVGARTAAADRQGPVDLAPLLSLGLFGADTTGIPAMASATPSNTDLRLEGVILGSTPDASRAFIVSQGQQRTYRIGDVLPGAGDVTLRGIEAGRVIIDYRGSMQSLQLFTPDARVAPASADSAGVRTVAMPLSAGQADLRTAAATLGEIIQVTPAQENGRLVGYRLSPGSNLREFVRLGLETNDVVTSVNGIALDDMANLPQLYALMNDATEVSFSLLREGQPLTRHIRLEPAQ